MYTKKGLHQTKNKIFKHAINIVFAVCIKNKIKKRKKLLTFVEAGVNIVIVNSREKQIFINKYLLKKQNKKVF